MYKTTGFARKSLGGTFEKIDIERNEVGPEDVEFEIKYCGICHSDVHIADNLFGATKYPIIPGHELAGIVCKVGDKVTKYKVGDHVGVGCIVDSCMTCEPCSNGDEHICVGGFNMTYDSETKHGHIATNTGYTFGGYSERITMNQRYVVAIPDGYDLQLAGPILCAGVTMYSPLKYWGALKGGIKVGIVGIGGLGQMGIRLAAAMGCEVTAISTNVKKKKLVEEIGAKHFVVSTDPASMKAADSSLDLILNTISAPHEMSHYFGLLRRDATIVQLGLVVESHKVNQMPIMSKRIRVSGSFIGGMIDTQEVIDFCHAKKIKPEVEIITASQLDQVYEKLNAKHDSITRFVLDISKSLQ